MNPFLNPIFLSKILKKYIFDIDRLKNLDEDDLRKYQNKQFKKILQFAYTVPLYHEKYKKVGIYPGDIKGIQDIKKLPIITKFDIKQYYPNGIISSKMRKDKLIKITTSGTTGKSLSIYSDFLDSINWLFEYIRVIKEYGISWRKNKLTIIGDFRPYTIGSRYISKELLSNLNHDFFFSNMQFLDTNEKSEKLIEDINRFNPEFIGGYIFRLSHLALLKEEGYGENINPKYIATIGYALTDYLRKLIEEVFGSHVFEVYGATESGTIAFQCKNRNFHVMSDMVYLEFLKDNIPVKSKEPCEMIITKLYGLGTPIIRYNSVNDIVAPLYEKCSCGMSGDLIYKIYGRNDLSVYLPDGKLLLPSSITDIFGKVLYELRTRKIKDNMIIQHDLKKIEVQIVFDREIRNDTTSVDEIFSVLRKGFQEKIGSEIDIIFKEVKKISSNRPRIISKLNKEKFEILQYV